MHCTSQKYSWFNIIIGTKKRSQMLNGIEINWSGIEKSGHNVRTRTPRTFYVRRLRESHPTGFSLHPRLKLLSQSDRIELFWLDMDWPVSVLFLFLFVCLVIRSDRTVQWTDRPLHGHTIINSYVDEVKNVEVPCKLSKLLGNLSVKFWSTQLRKESKLPLWNPGHPKTSDWKQRRRKVFWWNALLLV